MDHSSPKEFNARLREAVTYISAVKACIVFSDTGLYHRIFEVMTKSILVVAQNLTDSQDTVDKLVKVSWAYTGIDDKGHWRRQLSK